MLLKIETDEYQLRKFGITIAVFFSVLFGLFIPWFFEFSYKAWPFVVASVFLVVSLIYPVSLKSVFLVWMLFSTVLNKINTIVILSVTFYAVLLPVGLLKRVFSKKIIHKNWDRDALSYRITSKPITKEDMEKPY